MKCVLTFLSMTCLAAPWAGNAVASEPVWLEFCGDGVLNPGEECDPGLPGLSDPDLGGRTCQSEGYSGGELGCTAAGPGGAGCTLDRSACLCEDEDPAAPVPWTGQTECWGADGLRLDCAGTGQDGESRLGASVDPRFTDNLDGTVTDNLTGLTWLKQANCLGPVAWVLALSEVRDLADGRCGLMDGSLPGDWRLPNLKELESLVDFGHFSPALPPGHPFSWIGIAYWSSTSVQASPVNAWCIYIGGGGRVDTFAKGGTRSVWPVRDSGRRRP